MGVFLACYKCTFVAKDEYKDKKTVPKLPKSQIRPFFNSMKTFLKTSK